MSKQTLMKGTLILTAAGFLTRILGFLYRIWLSETLGAELIGIYQLVFPVYSVFFTIYASGIQTAISKLAAESERFLPRGVLKSEAEASHLAARLVFRTGFLLSFGLALLLSFGLYYTAPFVAARLLFEPRATVSLRILSFIFPFCSVTSCINGYYYGRNQSAVPAVTQLIEQSIRIVSVYLFAGFIGNGQMSCEIAVLGLIFGESASALFNLISFAKDGTSCKRQAGDARCLPSFLSDKLLKEISRLALPLSFNRLVVSLLHSFEATLVPFMLRRYGMSVTDSLSYYGILNGMSLPFLFFPTAITSALAVLLLPAVSTASAKGQTELLHTTVFRAQKFSVLLGMLSCTLFLLFGYDLGVTVFSEPLAGRYLMTLAWLCPFLYLSSTYSSILNGLGKPYQTFCNSVIAMCVKIAIIFFGVPHFGMPAYLASLLASQMGVTILDGVVLYRTVGASCLPDSYLLRGGLVLVLLALPSAWLYRHASAVSAVSASPYFTLIIFGGGYCLAALLLFFISGTLSKEELALFRKQREV